MSEALRTLQDLLPAMAARGDGEAMFALRPAGEARWSYAELAATARRLAAGLLAAGLVPGEAVAILSPNRPEWVIARLALIAAGALVVPLDEQIADAELARALADSGCRRVFATRVDLGRLTAIGGLAPILLDDGDDELGWRRLLAPAPAAMPPVDPDDVAALFYTSGTTGPPKGVPLGHRNLAANLGAIAAEGFIGPGDRVLLPLPLHHAYPFLIGMLLPLASGATLVLPAGVTGPELVAGLRVGRATAMVGVPRLYEALVAGIEARVAARGKLAAIAYRLLLALSIRLRRRHGIRLGRRLFARLHRELAPRLALLACGGARLEPAVEWALMGLGWEVMTGYGLVETTSIATFNPRGRTVVGSAGRPVPGVELRIAGADADGRGEVLIRGPNLFAGYHDDEAATRAAFAADGWFRSGDLGHLDADGYLFLDGRMKELIVLSDGKNVTPEKIEAHYAENPFIAELAVLEDRGALVALVVPDLEAMRGAASGRIEDTIRVALAERSATLASFERISGYAITREALPRTRLGKYRRHALAPIYARASAGTRGRPATAEANDPEAAALLADPVLRRLWGWLGARYPDRVLGFDTAPQLDLGIDSLAWIDLGLEIERRFGIRLGEPALARILTLGDLLREAAQAGVGPGAAPRAIDPRWLAPPGPLARAVGVVLYGLCRVVIRRGFRLRIDGAAGVPATGPYVVAVNHLSDLDPFVVAAALPWSRLRTTHWGGDVQRLFHTPARRLLARAAQVFPVDDRAAETSLAYVRAVLDSGGGLIWFPEGWRSPDGRLQAFMGGIGPMLAAYDGPVVPAAIRGTFEALPRGRRLPRRVRVRITFGPPRTVDDLAAAGAGAGRPARIADGLRRAILEAGAPG